MRLHNIIQLVLLLGAPALVHAQLSCSAFSKPFLLPSPDAPCCLPESDAHQRNDAMLHPEPAPPVLLLPAHGKRMHRTAPFSHKQQR